MNDTGANGHDSYEAFLRSKVAAAPDLGLTEIPPLHDALFPFQRDIVAWALRKGRAAIFAECGMGKTIMQLEWARHVPGRVLILAPLAVAQQTVREGEHFGIPCMYARSQDEADGEIVVTNYEMLSHFDTSQFVGVVLDESSILKSYMGNTKQQLIRAFAGMRWKLCCTATPAPNDHMELGNHAQFLDVMASNEMLARWFINNSMNAGDYRLKEHGEDDFWRWVHSWAVSIEKPSDLGHDDDGFILPPLRWHEHRVESAHDARVTGTLFPEAAVSATTIHRVMRASAPERARKVAELVASNRRPWIVWCNTNYEADELAAAIPESVDVRGSESLRQKESKLLDFIEGRTRVLVTKPTVAGFGLNLQHCSDVAFVGLSYSYEQLYQAIRRSWRFGQAREVNAHVICTDADTNVVQTIRRKERDHEKMKHRMVAAMRKYHGSIDNDRGLVMSEDVMQESGERWTMLHGDCVAALRGVESNSIGLTVFSPPFSNLYIYSDRLEDMGNSVDHAEFFEHFRYAIRELLRVTIPGRICAVHCKDLPLYKNRDGAAGLYDFPGEIIRTYSEEGWTYHSRVTIWKCPVTEMQRTKNHGLLYKQLRKDSSASRQGMADYIVAFRKNTDADAYPNPVEHTKEEFPLDRWQAWASPVWDDVNQMRVLNYRSAKDAADSKHICPIQLDIVERCVMLWSNPGDLVLSPFAGIGSEGYMAVKLGRRFLGIELKDSYFQSACRNLAEAEREARAMPLFEATP